MRTQTIIKELSQIESLLRQDDQAKKQKAVEKLRQLKAKLQYKLKEEQQKKQNQNPDVYNLSRWYYSIWQGKLPEIYYARAAKVFKELLEEGNLTKEEIKELYSFWLEIDEEKITDNTLKRKYAFILTGKHSKSITDFKGKYRYIKDLKTELEKTKTKKWTSPDNERGLDYYLKHIEEDPNQPEAIDINDDDEDVPF